MANSLDSDGGDLASVRQNFVDSTEVAPSHSNLQSSSGSCGFLEEVAADSSAESTNKTIAVPVEEITRSGVAQEFHGYVAVVSNNAEMSFERIEEQKQEGLQVECSAKCANETQVIERASLLGPHVGGDGKVIDVNDSKRNTKQRKAKEKKQTRRGGKNRRNSEISFYCPSEISFHFPIERYSTVELLSLRFENVEEQKKKWAEVYCGLGAQVVGEYNGLVGVNRAREKNSIPNFDFDPRPQFQKSVNLGEVCFPEVEGDLLESLNASDPSSLPYEDDDRRNSEIYFYDPIERYSTVELLSLRFENVEEQKKKWVEVYWGLGAQVVEEYNGLVGVNRARGKSSIPNFDFDPRPQLQKSVNLGEVCFSKVEGDHLENLNVSDPFSLPYEDDDSDEEYSIQRPAFMLTGEPDFDSGPPLDGLEYLRRVRWEAARIPKVKVAKVNKVKEQSIYLPQIPDVMKCPEKLLPLKQWEDSFLSDFSQLREAFTRLELQELGSVKEDFLNRMLDRNTFDKFVSSDCADDSCPSPAPCILETSEDNSAPSSPDSSGPVVDRPTLSRILKMDSAARTSMLKRQISASMNMDRLPYNDSLWLFALCATIDCPLHADTSAALRSLLRKCASLRAAKTEVDDEVITLNILATIAGRYFGQLERE